MTRTKCREEMHYAEYQARRNDLTPGQATAIIKLVERAYYSPECEDRVAMRLSAAISKLEMVAL